MSQRFPSRSRNERAGRFPLLIGGWYRVEIEPVWSGLDLFRTGRRTQRQRLGFLIRAGSAELRIRQWLYQPTNVVVYDYQERRVRCVPPCNGAHGALPMPTVADRYGIHLETRELAFVYSAQRGVEGSLARGALDWFVQRLRW